MKRMIAILLVLAAVLALSGCGEAPKSADLTALYEACLEIMPEMNTLDNDTMLNFLGIDAAQHPQAIAALCTDGMRTDEIWLIEAKDEAARKELEELAANRLQAKGDESVTYSPEQYAIVQKAQVLVEGNYIALLVSPEVDALAEAFTEAFQ